MCKILAAFFLIITVVSTGELQAQGIRTTPSKKFKNCHILVKSTYKLEGVKENTRHFKFKNRAGCEKMKRILSDNFSPSEITKVETKMEWSGK